ncbi:MAG TPA: CARDB domain-containing protein [Pirellulales bacterium]|jgi:hypothetical protein|nr:CARDB domain-containing protein [Pirellulales bacterium]
MTIRFNTFRNRFFATIVAALAMTNVTFAKSGGGGGKGFGGGKSFSGAKSMAVKNFAPKMIAKQPALKSGQANLVNKNFGNVKSLGVQKLNSSSFGTMKSSLNASKLTSKSFGQLKSSDLFKKVGKDSSMLGNAKKLSNSDALSKVGILDKSKITQKLPSSPTNKIPNPNDPAGPFKTGGPFDAKKNSKIGDILKDPAGKFDPTKVKDPGMPGKIDPGKIDPGKVKDPGKIDPGKIDPGKIDPGKGTTPTDPGKGTTPTDPGKGTTPTTPTDPGMDKHDHCSPWWIGVVPWGGWGGGYGGGGYGGGGYAGGGYAEPAPVYEAPATQSYQSYAQATQAQPVGTGSVDLVLEDVRMIDRATVAAGPAYAVRFRNQGTANAGAFRVAIFAAAGSLNDDAPRAVIEVPGLSAGETKEMALRLPVSAMRLVSSNGSQGAFDRLLVLVDPDDAVVESDKTNNLAGIDRAALESQAR